MAALTSSAVTETARKARAEAVAPDSISNLATDFVVSLRARNKAARTIETYSEAIGQLDDYLGIGEHRGPCGCAPQPQGRLGIR